MNFRKSLVRAALAALLVLPAALPAQDPAPARTMAAGFEAQLDAMLVQSRDGKRGLVFHIKGQRIPGVVKEISEDAVVVGNQERSRILIRRAWIDAVEGD